MTPTKILFLTLLLTSSTLFAANAIQIENAKPGDPEWKLTSEAQGEIEGYPSAASVNRGESISIFVNTTEPNYTLEIFRMGWYGGAGARRVHGPIVRAGIRQTTPAPDANGMVECRWQDPYVVFVPGTPDPTDWASGVYLVRLTANSSGKNKFVMFVVRDDTRPSNHLFQTGVTTYQAYNNWGGKSLYSFNSSGGEPAVKVSFDRPYADGSGTGTFLYRWEYNMVRFLEREGYDVTYSTNIETHARGDLLRMHKSFLSVGHDEYWSWEMRANVTAARDAGVGLGFFSANTCYWQVRLEANPDGVLHRRMVGYKNQAQTRDPYAIDGTSANDHLVTTQFRMAPVNLPEAALLGVEYQYDPVVDGDIVIDDVTSAQWVFEGTGLVRGSVLPKLLGYEVDAITSSSPHNIIRLGHSPYSNTKVTPTRTDYSDMTVYTAASGATVFATGSIQWALGLDDWLNGQGKVHPGAQQLTRNVLRRFAGSNASADCFYALSPKSASVGTTAGSGTIGVTAHSYCGWSAVSNDSWITITGASTTAGSGSISYQFAANSGAARTGTITVGDQTFTLSQQNGCVLTINPNYASFSKNGGTGSVTTISASSANCPWTAVPEAPWVTISGPSSGNGSGNISYNVAANVGPTRRTRIRFGSDYETIDQSDGCVYTVSPTSTSIGSAATNIFVDVSPTSGLCHWTTSSAYSWLQVTVGATGRGNGTVTIAASANTASTPRSGEVYVAGIPVRITQAAASATVMVRGDFNSDGTPDLVWRNSITGANAVWFTANRALTGSALLPGTSDTNWRIGAADDFNGDGKNDLVWRHTTNGAVAVWLMNGAAVTNTASVGSINDPNWLLVGSGDFNGDNKPDLVWRHQSTGSNAVWYLNGTTYAGSALINAVPDTGWHIAAVVDINGDRKPDLVWRHRVSGQNAYWTMNGVVPITSIALPGVADLDWRIVAAGDYSGDGKADLVWRHDGSGANACWVLNTTGAVTDTFTFPTNRDPGWDIVGPR